MDKDDRRPRSRIPKFQQNFENVVLIVFSIRVENINLIKHLNLNVKRMNRLRQRFLEKSKFEKLVSDELEMHDGPNGTIE